MADEARRSGPIDTAWLAKAGPLIADLGFTIVTRVHEGDPAATDLLVALRDEPTLRHFDPEEVSYWAPEEGRGRPRHVDRETHVPFEGRFLWGRISIADRLGLTNQWLSFGGAVHAAELDPATTVVGFESPAPIQRWSGHSQGLDPLTPEMGAFFGRLMIPIDFEPGAEALVSAATPLALYCAFIHDLQARLAGSEELRRAHPGHAAGIPAEAHRLGAANRTDWRAGVELLAELGVGLPA